MIFIYLFILGLNFSALSAESKNNKTYLGINKCEINHIDINTFNFKEVKNNNSKISITSSVRIRNKRINLAIIEAKLKAKKKLIRFLENEYFDNPEIVRFSNNSSNYELRGTKVSNICIQNGLFLYLTLEINNKIIDNAKKLNKYLIPD